MALRWVRVYAVVSVPAPSVYGIIMGIMFSDQHNTSHMPNEVEEAKTRVLH